MDLITSNQVRLGRNNDRSQAGTMEVTGNPDRILKKKIEKFLIHGSKPGWYFMYQDWRIILNGFLQIITSKIVMSNYSWNNVGCLVTASSMVWLMKLYPAKMVLFVKWLSDIEIIPVLYFQFFFFE